MKKLSPQQQKVYDYLKEKGKATVRELFPFTNYPTCIVRDLKKKGIDIETVPVEGVNHDIYILKNDLTLFG